VGGRGTHSKRHDHKMGMYFCRKAGLSAKDILCYALYSVWLLQNIESYTVFTPVKTVHANRGGKGETSDNIRALCESERAVTDKRRARSLASDNIVHIIR
jgi:hypothetical protein